MKSISRRRLDDPASLGRLLGQVLVATVPLVAVTAGCGGAVRSELVDDDAEGNEAASIQVAIDASSSAMIAVDSPSGARTSDDGGDEVGDAARDTGPSDRGSTMFPECTGYHETKLLPFVACPEPLDASGDADASDGDAERDAGACIHLPLSYSNCPDLCRSAFEQYSQLPFVGAFLCSVDSTGAEPMLRCELAIPCGRRPSRWVATRRASSDSIASFLAASAELESASVAAFGILARELEEHGAPDRLLAAARKARRDEVRHTRIMVALARQRGEKKHATRVASPSGRDLFSIAFENAVEGCVREAFGALIAMHQAEQAEDPRVRAAMRSIAADEIEHAALAWAVARWAEPRLTPPQRDHVERARRRALCDLERDIRLDLDAGERRLLGLPDGSRQRALARSFRAALSES